MKKVVVSEEALREMVKEALDGGHLGDLTVHEEEEPVNVNPVVDPSASQTDPINPDFVPQTKPELDIAIKQLTKIIPVEKVPHFYKTLRAVIDVENKQSEEDVEMKKAAQGGTDQVVEKVLRKEVRKILSTILEARPDPWKDALPPTNPNNVVPRRVEPGVHGGEATRRIEKTKADLRKGLGKAVAQYETLPDDDEDDSLPPASGQVEVEPAPTQAPQRRHAYKVSALGGVSDVGGMSFESIANELTKQLRAEAEEEFWQDFDDLTVGWDEDRKVAKENELQKKLNAAKTSDNPDDLKKFFAEFGKQTSSATSGAKRIHDEAFKKAQFIMMMDEDDLEILVLTTVKEYVEYLAKSGELSAADVQLMKDHPQIVRELDGFREYLDNVIKRARREDQKISTFGESKKTRTIVKGNLKIVLEKADVKNHLETKTNKTGT